MDKYQVQWREPSEQLAERVKTYCSTFDAYAQGFGYFNPRHAENSRQLQHALRLKHIQWLRQTHSAEPCRAPTGRFNRADACWTRRAHHACAVMTADCLPVFFSNDDATQVAVAHAGWRGLAAGILQRALACFRQDDKVHAAFGPAICQEHYEVGEELLRHFPYHHSAFSPHKQQGKYYLSLYDLASRILKQHKSLVPPIIPKWCTYKDKNRLPSHRRDPAKCQRIANLIWLI